MNEFTVRPVVEGEQRSCYAVLAQSLHGTVPADDRWELIAASFPPEHKLAAFDGGSPIGIVSSFATELRVPGGNLVSTAAIDGVGVRADWTRRGVLSALIAQQLPDLVRSGHLLAALYASEATIYGRFGYGPASYGRTLLVSRSKARWRTEVPLNGRVRLLSPDQAVQLVPEVYRTIGPHRPGMIARPDTWWPNHHERYVSGANTHRVAVHAGPRGDDGFATFETSDQRALADPGRGAILQVKDLHAATPEALAGLWRFLLGVDLVAEVHAHSRPVDEPLPAMVTDARACQVTGVQDELWVRLLNVEAALNARSYFDAEPVVLDVHDSRLPANSGRYLLTPDGATRTDADADVRLDVDVLSMLYLGAWRASVLAQAGRLELLDAAAAPRLDELFRTTVPPWCGTQF